MAPYNGGGGGGSGGAGSVGVPGGGGAGGAGTANSISGSSVTYAGGGGGGANTGTGGTATGGGGAGGGSGGAAASATPSTGGGGGGGTTSSYGTNWIGGAGGSGIVIVRYYIGSSSVNLSGAFSGNGAGLTNLSGSSIADGSIGTARLAADAVTSAKIQNGTITTDDLNLASVDGRYVKLTGSTLAGILDAGSNRITNLATPVNDLDAVNKAYMTNFLANLSPLGDLTMGTYTNHP